MAGLPLGGETFSVILEIQQQAKPVLLGALQPGPEPNSAAVLENAGAQTARSNHRANRKTHR
jgi:hypothetical protein